MKSIINIAVASSLLLAVNSFGSCDEIYLKAGAGYKFDESLHYYEDKKAKEGYSEFDEPISARFESGIECGNLTFGISHHSQWATGAPFNNRSEPYKTEFFIDYKFSFGL